eukprot:gene16478-7894_t
MSEECYVRCSTDFSTMQELWERLANFQAIPALNQEAEYKIYSLKKAFADHMSVVFSHDQKTYISIEVVIRDTRRGKETALISRIIKDEHVPKLEFYKAVVTTASTIVAKATKTFQRFVKAGEYKKVFNNCQHYAINLLEALGVDNAPFSDVAKATTGGILAVIGGALLALFGAGKKQK